MQLSNGKPGGANRGPGEVERSLRDLAGWRRARVIGGEGIVFCQVHKTTRKEMYEGVQDHGAQLLLKRLSLKNESLVG